MFVFRQKRFNGLLRRNPQLFGEVVDGGHARRCEFFQSGRFGFRISDRRRHGRRKLDVGCIVTVRREGDSVLARLGKHVKFMGMVTANRAGIGLDSTEI